MRVILKKAVKNIGEAGEIHEVNPGYGRNFLIPRGLAILATDGSVSHQTHLDSIANAIKRKELAGATELAAKFDDLVLTIRREAGDDDKLFGSVTKRDITEALLSEGVEVDRKMLVLAANIRAIGVFTVPVKIHRDVEASVKVYVIRS